MGNKEVSYKTKEKFYLRYCGETMSCGSSQISWHSRCIYMAVKAEEDTSIITNRI
ncbi:hypothetical protein BN79_120 [Yersinia phage phiR2-01]|uniref:Uncharacterized protein n=1 Tax=Yersinia phage phiR2-01 TaxID=1206557 RepID=I7LH11_9CAUD|nr:hypothetical protein BN79_120 [Yersinia phage phiR2-01]CCI88529.1 hypothetical protein BN79_120 [Yersinia phage phiR2-01]